MLLPSKYIRLQPNCEIGHDTKLVRGCMNLIEHVNANKLIDYIENLERYQ